MADLEERILRLENGDRFRGQVCIGEACRTIFLLIDYIISLRTNTNPISNRSLDKMEKDLQLTGYSHDCRTITERYETDFYRSSTERRARVDQLYDIKTRHGLNADTEKYISQSSQMRNRVVHDLWTDENLALLKYYLDNERKAKGFLPDIYTILINLRKEAEDLQVHKGRKSTGRPPSA
jgi:hypothetical protein